MIVNANYAFADLNLASVNDSTPIHIAATLGHTAVVQALLASRSVDANKPTCNDGWTPLFAACNYGHEGIASLLVDSPTAAVDVNQADHNGWTPLYTACNNGQVGIVRILLATGRINVDTANHEGCTPLYTAARYGHYDIVVCLIEQGKARIDLLTHSGWSPLYIAASNNRIDVVQYLLTVDSTTAASVATVLILFFGSKGVLTDHYYWFDF